MNPEIEDPNNHVPAVAPEDSWDDYLGAADSPLPGLPPKRVEQGLPPKKESRTPRVKLLSPVVKLDRDVQADPSSPSGDGSGSDGGDEAEELQPPVAPAKASRKSKRKQSAGKGDESPSVEAEADETAEPSVGRKVIPDAQPAKRLKVNEIGSTSQSPAARPEILNIAKIGGDTSGEAISPHQQKRRRHFRDERKQWGENDQPASLKWMLYTGLGVFFLVILGVALSQLLGRGGVRDGEFPAYGRMIEPDGESGAGSDDLKELALLTNSLDEAKAQIAAYAGAKEVGDLLGLVHAPERNREVIEKKWKPLATKPGWTPGDDSLWNVIDRSGIGFGILDCTLSDFTNFRAYFRQDEEGLRLDWKATTGYGTADFAEMKKGKGDASEVRALVSLADFYTYSFPEEKFRSYRIMSPDGEVNLWGYVPADGEIEQELLKLFLPSPVTGESQSECQLTLSLEPGNEGSLPDQWLIKGILRQDWLDE